MWSKEEIDILTKLWNRGEPARIIALQLRTTRNAVIGKAHRLGLSKQVGGGDTESAPATIGTADLTEKMCRWPIGHPGDDDFRFCGEPSIPTRPYCGEHCVQAYRGRSEEAA